MDLGHLFSQAVSDVGHFLGVNQPAPKQNNSIAPARTSAPQTAQASAPVRTTAPGQVHAPVVRPVQAPSIAPVQTADIFSHIQPAQIGTTGKGNGIITKAGIKSTPQVAEGAGLGAAKAAYDVAAGLPKMAAGAVDAAGNKLTHQQSSSRVSKVLNAPDAVINAKAAKLSPTAKSGFSAGNISGNTLSALAGGESAAGTEGSRVLDAAAAAKNATRAATAKATTPVANAIKTFDAKVTPLNETGGAKVGPKGGNVPDKPTPKATPNAKPVSGPGSRLQDAGSIAKQRVDQLKANAKMQPGTRAKTPAQQPLDQSSPAPTVPKAPKSGARPSTVSPSGGKSVVSFPKNTTIPPDSQAPHVPTAVAPGGQKLSRFANKTVQNSDQVDLATKKLVDEKAVSYTPQATKSGQDVADQLYGKKDLNQSEREVTNALNSAKDGQISRQDVFNAHKVAERLQQTGKIEDKAAASDIYAKLSDHHTAAGQQIQAAAALAKQSPEGMLYSATKSLKNAGVKVEGKVLDNVTGAIDDYKKALDDAGITHNTDAGVKVNGNKAATQAGKEQGVDTTKLTREQSDAQTVAYQQFVDKVNKNIPRTKLDAGLNIWRAGLLTGPETAAKVAVSHLITAPLELASKPLSATIDKATSLFTKQRGFTFSPRDLKAGAEGYQRGLNAAKLKFTTGADLPGTGGFEPRLGKSSVESTYEKIPTRLHASIAKPNFAAEHEMSLRSQAYAAAVNKGLKGAERDQFMQEFLAKPPKTALETAQKEAEHFTNQQKTILGQGASGIQKGLPGNTGVLLAPFTRIPGAIGAKGLVDWTPLGLGKAVSKVVSGVRKGNFDQRAFSQDLGRSITGTGIAVIGYELLAHGRMSLASPSDTKEKALNLQQNTPRNSIYVGGKTTKDKNGDWTRTGGKWISLNAFGPAGITMGLGAGFRNAVEQGKGALAAVTQAAATGAKVLADQPYLKGISGAANAVNNPSQYAQTFMDSTVGSVVPAASSQVARGTDQTQRAYNPGVKGTIAGEIPGARETLPAQLDTFGKPVPSGNKPGVAGGVAGMLNPFYPVESRNQSNPVTKELQRLYTSAGSQGAPAFAEPQKTMTINGQKMKLSPDQMNRYIAASGPLIQSGVANLLQNPDYAKLTDAQKTSQINDIITGARTAAKVQVFGSNPKTLTGSERTAIMNPNQLGKDVQLPGLHLANGIDPGSKSELSKVYGMTSAAKANYLNDPKNKYTYDVATYRNDVLNGKYDSVQQQTKQQQLAKQGITSNYSNQVNELYGMSKGNITTYLENHPNDAPSLEAQLVAMDKQLYDGGMVSSLKFKTGVTTSGSGGSSGGKSGGKAGAPVKAPTNTTDAFKTLESILKSTMKVGKVSSPKAPKIVGYKPSSMKVGKMSTSGGSKPSFKLASKSIKQPKSLKSESLPKLLKPSHAGISTSKKSGQRIKLTV